MANVVIYSEPLIESFGAGFTSEEQAKQSCSGDALNLACAITRGLERLSEFKKMPKGDHHIGILCGLGDDEHGAKLREFMEGEGLNTDNVIPIKNRKTGRYEISREEDGSKRSVKYYNRDLDSAMCRLFEPGEHSLMVRAKLDNIAGKADVLVITGIGASRANSPAAFDRLVKLATAVKIHGGKVIVDLNHRFHAEDVRAPDGSLLHKAGDAKLWVHPDGSAMPNSVVRKRMDRLFALADVAFVAHDEIWPMYGDLYNPPLHKQDAADPQPIVKHLRSIVSSENGERHIVFKQGAKGGTLFFNNGGSKPDTLIQTVSHPVQTVDRNGGGDNLIGGTVAGLLSGYTLDQALPVGQLMAGKVIQHKGGVIERSFLPSDEELAARVPQTPQTDFKIDAKSPRYTVSTSSPFRPL